MKRKRRLTITFNPTVVWLLVAVAVVSAISFELGSETMTMTTTYPSPAGIYAKLISTQATTLGRDIGPVTIGKTGGATTSDLIVANGNANVNGSIVSSGSSGYVQVSPTSGSSATCGAGNKGAIIWNGTAFQGCDGTSWTSFGGGSSVVTKACNATTITHSPSSSNHIGSAASFSCSISLGAGTWLLRADMSLQQYIWKPATLSIDGTTIQTTENYGDTSGTGYIFMFGVLQVVGGTHTASATYDTTADWGTPRFLLTATKIGS